MLTGDTIAAIATAPGRGGVAIVRVSGPEALAVAARLTREEGREKGEEGRGKRDEGREVRFARLFSPVSPLIPLPSSLFPPPSTLIDECVVLSFRAPHSYTGEDVVEFQCHGGTVTPRRVLEACFAAGARLARRGEFTQRAFLNGKLDYDQAESVLDLVDAKTDRAADAALGGLTGRKRREDRTLYEEALAISVELEHALDIDEGELPDDFLPSIASRISHLASEIGAAIRRAREGKLLREGALVVLAGPPNAGKSSLMNAFLEENRAIVSDTPGTTRDSIEEWLDLEGWPVRLVDTAGLREAGDAIEAEGVKRAEDLIARADVVLALLPPPSSLIPHPPSLIPPSSSLIPLHAKCDLGRGEGLNVSAKTGEGLDALKRAIVAKLEASFVASAASVDDRRLSVLLDVSSTLSPLIPPPSSDPVLLGNAVRSAAERLGSLVGATYSADLLENLFSRFCVGK